MVPTQLKESFQLILDTSQTLMVDPAHGRPGVSAEGLERMLQAATYGAQALDSANKRAMTDGSRESGETNGDEVEGNAPSAVQVG